MPWRNSWPTNGRGEVVKTHASDAALNEYQGQDRPDALLRPHPMSQVGGRLVLVGATIL
jgi:hypothetical protein